MDFESKVKNYIIDNALFTKEDRLLVACSGGADSMSLLYFLNKEGYELFCCHVNHGLRETAKRDEDLVRRFCEQNGIPFCGVSVDVKKRVAETGETVEEAARILRYEALEKAYREENCTAMVLAHHEDDQAETILFQMIRGSGLRGLRGMQARTVRGTERRFDETASEADSDRSPVVLVRPFLAVTRDEIRAYAAAENIEWCEDETNALDDATRNRIRHEILPALRLLRPDAAEKIAASGSFAGEADDHFRKKAECFLADSEKANIEKSTIAIEKTAFLSLEAPLPNYVIMAVLRHLGVPMKDKGRKHVEALAGLFLSATGREISLPDGGYGIREANRVVFAAEKEAYLSAARFRLRAFHLEIRKFSYKKGMEIPENSCRKWFDNGKIKGTPMIRTRQAGDRIFTGEKESKPLREFMIDRKIPECLRDALPIVADDENVLWVPDYRMSAAHRITDETKEVLEITLVEEA